MDEKQAALKVYVLWAWLELNPGCDKKEHPLYLDLNIGQLILECPWCELYRRKNDNCVGCPLVERVDERCMITDSWYERWEMDIFFPGECSIAAGNIAALAWSEYKRLGG